MAEANSRMSFHPVPPSRPLQWPEIVERLPHIISMPHRLYLVGGVVRDALCHRPITDIDIVTHERGTTVAREVADRLAGHYYTLDSSRDIGRAIIAGKQAAMTVDVATVQGESLLDDLRARDFTINAMAVRLDRLAEVVDPLGGQRDLFSLKTLRQCASESVSADPVRAIRAVRLSLQFGLRLDKPVVTAIREAQGALIQPDGRPVQPERTRDELFKLFNNTRPGAAVRVLNGVGLLPALGLTAGREKKVLEQRFAVIEALGSLLELISPQRNDNTAADLSLGVAVMVLDHFRHELQRHLAETLAGQRTRHSLLCIASCSEPGSLDWSTWAVAYSLSKAERQFLQDLENARQYHWEGRSQLEDGDIYRYYRDSGSAGVDGVLLMLAEYLAAHFPMLDARDWGTLLEKVAAPLLAGYFERHAEVVSPSPLLSGDDIQRELYLRPGPIIGTLLERLREGQASGRVHTRVEALHFVKRLLEEDC